MGSAEDPQHRKPRRALYKRFGDDQWSDLCSEVVDSNSTFFYFFLQVQREKEKQIKNAEKCTIATLMDDSIMARYIIMGLL